MIDIELDTTWDDWLAAGKWDAECGNQMQPPELRADHPYRRVYIATYLQTFREELQWHSWDGWPLASRLWRLA